MTAGSPEASSVSNGDLSDNINVVVRVRPTNDIETRHKDSHALQYPGEGQILVPAKYIRSLFACDRLEGKLFIWAKRHKRRLNIVNTT